MHKQRSFPIIIPKTENMVKQKPRPTSRARNRDFLTEESKH